MTNFGPGGVSKFNNSGGLVSSTFMATGGQATPESVNIVRLGPYAGSTFVGGSGGASVDQYDTATGTLLKTWTVSGGNGTGGTDWTDLGLDHHTLFYDGEGSVIRTYDLSTGTQGPDFYTAAQASLYELRVIPDGSLSGDVLVADSAQALLISSAGTLLKTYTLPGDGGGDFSLNLDPNGMDFWTGDFVTGTMWDVNISTGAIDQQWSTGSSSLYGVSVYGEITSGGGGGPPPVPELSTWAMMVAGFAGLGLMGFRRKAGA